MIALTSLCAEGTPVLVLEMCRWWLAHNIQPMVVTLNAEPTDLVSEFQQLGIQIHSLNISNYGYRRYGQIILKFYRICHQFQPDALLSMPLGWHTFIAYGARLAGVRRIAAHAGNYPPYWTGTAFQKFRFLIQLGRPVTDILICCSDYVRQGVIKYLGVPESETVTIYNGCPLEQFYQSNSPLQFPSNHVLNIGMVARLEKHKDQPTLIRTAHILKERGMLFKVQLIGEGSRRGEYETLIQQEQVEDCVYLLGMRRDIPKLLSEMDIFIFSAKPDEGLGVALIEAMATGVPIVATAVGACQEVLDQGNLGLLVKPHDSQALANGIIEILSNPKSAKSRAELAQKKVFREFTIENMAKSYASCLGLGV
ncbi:glycosyltransferase [Anabaena subtropica FACHB-260]|uniref:Glycosyltransferase n=1 Tax=Anabaena subtropica FACHB-260 TaxID=2692884 RepID=A0ABR8CLJ4_9NOST|nr:glycosyltransferase [Anabaena subtropica FACHB-260]